MTARTGDAYPADWPAVLIGHFLLRPGAGRPSDLAVVAGDEACTWAELAELVDAYREALIGANVGHGDAVLAIMQPGIELVATFIAVTDLGAVHVPCNADSPRARIAGIAAQVRARAIIAVGGEAFRAESDDDAAFGVPIFTAQRSGLATGGRAVRPLAPPARRTIESDTAYVIFTSGSTGTPKGVVMTHRAAVAAFRGIEQACDARGRLASCAPAGFDLSILDMAASLGRGETIVFVPKGLQMHPARLIDYLVRHRVAQMHSVPSLWQILLRFGRDRVSELTSLSRIVLGGEALTPALVEQVRRALPGLSVVNLYGQTESICCSFYDVPDELPPGATSIPVGEMYPGIDAVLIDEHGHEVTHEGGIGELYLRAASLFSGYWEAPEQTAERIVADPIDPSSREPWMRTGDLLCRRADGLHFVGRADRQVQLFGNRVELGEIEQCLGAHGGVAAAYVVAVSANGWDQPQVIAFVEPAATGQAPVTSPELLAETRQRLPKYMVPSRIVFVDEWPLAQTGKVDVAELATRAQEIIDSGAERRPVSQNA